MSNFDHITYATFGINPKTFYAGRFAGGAGGGNLLTGVARRYDIEFDRARFLAQAVRGPTVLDVGCGSGPYAGTIRAAVRPSRMVAIDLDPTCVEIAKQAYDEAFVFELGSRLPFKDGEFSTVFSCDVFGHIEFRHKDQVIEEIHRVTAPGGRSVHIIESGFLDYNAIDPKNPNDPLLQYVHMEGHIGVEPAQALTKRWGRFFKSVVAENATVYPLMPISSVLADPGAPGELKDLLSTFDERQREAAHVLLGYIDQKLRSHIRSVDPDSLVPDHASSNPLKTPSGLVYLVAEKAR